MAFVDLEGILPDGLVKDQDHVGTVVDHFRGNGVDCIFMPHCNFGTEGAVGMIGKRLGLPVLLWGPRDEAPLPDGTRLRDSLCGMLASSKVLHKLSVPFTYIENCRVGDDALRAGVDTFLRAAAVAATFRDGARIGVVGQRIDFFWTTIINESELLQRFNVELLPLDMVTLINGALARVEDDRRSYKSEIAELQAAVEIEGYESDAPLMRVLAVRDEIMEMIENHSLDGVAFQSFMSIVDACESYCSLAESMVGETCPIAAETDVHGVISDLILRRAALGSGPAYIPEFTIRHPENENGILLWHEGAPLSMCHPESRPKLGNHWILPSPLAGMSHFRLKDGPLTVARFDGDHGEYRLAVGEGHSTEGPFTLNNYVWMEVDDWASWERALIEGPFIHHCGMTYGHYGEALVEACKYVPGLEALRLGSAD